MLNILLLCFKGGTIRKNKEPILYFFVEFKREYLSVVVKTSNAFLAECFHTNALWEQS